MRKFIITVEGKQYEVGVEEVGAASSQSAPVTQEKAAPAPAQASAPAVKTAASANVTGTPIKAPMPGMIAGFKVENGSSVKKGQVVMVLEAMKMENDLSSPADGTITFRVQKGANVDTGEVLAVIS